MRFVVLADGRFNETKYFKENAVDQSKLNHYRTLLESMLRQFSADARSLQDETRSPGGGRSSGELSQMPTHMGDRGTEEYLAEMNSAMLENEQYLASEATAALARIQSGEFGRCEFCGDEIRSERLEAIPYTRYCRDCADKAAPAPMPMD